MPKNRLRGAAEVLYLDLLGNGKTYTVPGQQRPYAWRQEQWEDLWTDLTELRADTGGQHYLGALVVAAGDAREFSVIDGQQRLATLSLLVLAVIARLERLADQRLDAEANRQRAGRLRNLFIGQRHPASLVEASRLKLNETDDNYYQDYLVQLREHPNPRGLPRSSQRLGECFAWFGRQLEDSAELRDDGEALANLVFEVVGSGLVFLLITVADDLTAFTVFQTLNARGVQLTTTDLLRNHFFSPVRVDFDLSVLERRWRSILLAVGEERFPDFLRHHLLSEFPDIRKDGVYRFVRERYRSTAEVFELVGRLEARADLFAALGEPEHELWLELREAKPLVRELALFRSPEATPLLFAARETFAERDFVRVLRLVAVLSFRYRVVSDLSAGALEPRYAAAAKSVLDGAARDPRAVFSALQSIYVDDSRVRDDFGRLGLVTRGPNRALVRLILARLESDAAGKPCDPESDPFTVEHILPENPDPSWEAGFPRPRQEAFTYRLGNLTLLGGKANRRIGNAPYPEKLAAYESSEYELTRRIPELAPEAWTPALLERRQRQLASRAVHLWRSDFA